MTSSLKQLFVLLTLSLASLCALAANPPQIVPLEVGHAGVVTRIDKSRGTLTLGKQRYPLSPSVTVHTTSGRLVGIDTVNRGDKIQFRLAPHGEKGVKVIVEIWILPRSHKLQLGLLPIVPTAS